jgi:hypothetical protein
LFNRFPDYARSESGDVGRDIRQFGHEYALYREAVEPVSSL